MRKLALLVAALAVTALASPAVADSKTKLRDYGKCPSWGTSACRYQVTVNSGFSRLESFLMNLECPDDGWVDGSPDWDEAAAIKKSGSFSATSRILSGNDMTSNERVESQVHITGMVHKSKKGYKKYTITFKWSIDSVASDCSKYKSGKVTMKYIRSR